MPQASKTRGMGSTASHNPNQIPPMALKKEQSVISPASAPLTSATYEEMVKFLANTAEKLSQAGVLKRDRTIKLL
jgi:hypothetical protein